MSYTLNSQQIAKTMMVIVFLALIRCATEPFRLQHYSDHPLSLLEIRPFLWGAIVSATSLLAATIALFYRSFRIVTFICTVCITGLFALKWLFAVY